MTTKRTVIGRSRIPAADRAVFLPPDPDRPGQWIIDPDGRLIQLTIAVLDKETS